MSTLLQVKNITKIYPNQPKPGLDNISFVVAQGEFLGIMGASGSGKTTLLNVLSTIDVPTNGHIVMGKTHIEKLAKDRPLISVKTISALSFRNISFWIVLLYEKILQSH